MAKATSTSSSLIGLTQKEAKALLLKYGPNSVDLQPGLSPFLIFLKSFANPLILLLIASSSLAAYFGDLRSFFTIMTMILMSSVLDFYNVYKSDKAAQKLKDTVKISASVIRDGKQLDLSVEELVPGDIVRLGVGDIVPADGIIVKTEHCFTNESALTGESFPVPKEEGAEVNMGSSVSSGESLMRVTATGKQTRFSHIVANLSKKEPKTEFDREISSFSVLIIKVTIFLMLFVFLANALLKGDYLQSLMFAIALAVGMTPEMMPMIITINLTKGSLAMSKRGVIVKRLSSIQNFGSMDILCTDKTGTLTEDRIALVKYVDAHGNTSENALKYAYINSSLSQGFRNPLDDAVMDFKHLSIREYVKVDEIPYDFERKRETVAVRYEGEYLLVSKGAPEEILKLCTEYGEGRVHNFTEALRKSAHEAYEDLSRKGFRVLAVAYKKVAEKSDYLPADEEGMVFVGMVAFMDPPKETVAKTLKSMQEYGIGIKIITGDNELVSQRVAQEIGFEITGTVLGSEMEGLSEDELVKKFAGVNLFARVNPDQKLRIITTLQKRGHVVGYIGDGINDAPSLKAADVGISVNNATDIAKESADLIMIHKDLDDLVAAVLEGRKTFANTMKYLMMTLSSNFGNMFSMAGASILLPFLPMLPVQILLNNLLYDASQFSLPSDHVDVQDLKRPKRMRIGLVRKYMMTFGPISSLFDFATFGSLYFLLHLSERQFQTGWFMESLATQTFVVYIIRTKLVPFVQSKPSIYLLVGTVSAVLIGWIIAMTTIGKFFDFQPIGVVPLGVIAVLVGLYLVLVEVVKQYFYQKMVTKEELAWM